MGDLTSMLAGSEDVLMIKPTTYFLIPTEDKELAIRHLSDWEQLWWKNVGLTFTLVPGEDLPARFDDGLQNL